MYTYTFKDTFAVDLLEWFGIVEIPVVGTNYGYQEVEINSKNKYCEDNDSECSVDCATIQCGGGGKNGPSVSRQDKGDLFLVDWDGPDDPDHPQNWPVYKRSLIVVNVLLLICVTYMGSTISTAGQDAVEEEFNVGHVVGTLNLSLYVLGYGIGPMIFSPLSEFAAVGRQGIYIITLLIFTLLQIGAATVNNIGGLLVIRFFSGIFCSPALATGGASVADVVAPKYLTIFLGLWSVGAYVGPAVAPLVGAAMVVAKGWRWIYWLMLWLSAALLIILAFYFPETQHSNILYRRAVRIRKQTKDDRYYTEREVIERKSTVKEFLITALYRPFKIMVHEPIIIAFNVYLSLCYGVYYLFFEAFPIVFMGVYNFNLIELGLAYLGFIFTGLFSFVVLLLFFKYTVQPKVDNGTFTPETLMLLAIYVSWSLPASLFFFGWTASVHWILPILSELFFDLCVFNLFQVSFSYLAMCYENNVASVFAGNGFCRASFAFAFPLFGKALYNNLGTKNYPVAWGSSLLGFVAAAMMAIPVLIYKYGPYLRSKSSYTQD